MEFILIVAASLLCIVSASTIPPTTTTKAPPCICTFDYRPVCGVDGITYANKCNLDCAGTELAHASACHHVCICPMNYAPVCGQDGKTYSNQCEMNCNGVAFFQDGACQAQTITPTGGIQKRQAAPLCICTFIYRPVCGNDGITYGNECNLHCNHGIHQLHEGPCDGTEVITITTAAP